MSLFDNLASLGSRRNCQASSSGSLRVGTQIKQEPPDDSTQAGRKNQSLSLDESINVIIEGLMRPPGIEPLDSSREGMLTEIVNKLARHSEILERLLGYINNPVKRDFSVSPHLRPQILKYSHRLLVDVVFEG